MFLRLFHFHIQERIWELHETEVADSLLYPQPAEFQFGSLFHQIATFCVLGRLSGDLKCRSFLKKVAIVPNGQSQFPSTSQSN